MNKKGSIGECVSIYVPLDKAGEFWEIIESAGYERTSDGVLKFILESDMPFEDEDEGSGSIAFKAINEWAKNNPEQWSNIKKKGSATVRSLMNKMKNWKSM